MDQRKPSPGPSRPAPPPAGLAELEASLATLNRAVAARIAAAAAAERETLKLVADLKGGTAAETTAEMAALAAGAEAGLSRHMQAFGAAFEGLGRAVAKGSGALSAPQNTDAGAAPDLAAAAERFNQRALAALQGTIAERLRRIEALAKAKRGR